MKICAIINVISAIILTAFTCVVAMLSGAKKENKRLQQENNELKDEKSRQNEVIEDAVKAREEKNEKLDKIDSGNNSADFDNSVGLLHDIANRKKS